VGRQAVAKRRVDERRARHWQLQADRRIRPAGYGLVSEAPPDPRFAAILGLPPSAKRQDLADQMARLAGAERATTAAVIEYWTQILECLRIELMEHPIFRSCDRAEFNAYILACANERLDRERRAEALKDMGIGAEAVETFLYERLSLLTHRAGFIRIIGGPFGDRE
jgi:hypothetical protein